jgi:nucleotide-binding universal stress UspA family protein
VSSYRTVLVGTDGSASSFGAVERAAELAAATGARLLIASAFQPLSTREQERAAGELREDAYQVVGAHPAEDALREASALAARSGAAKDTIDTVAEQADAVDLLVDLIDKRDVDLCVVGNRGLNSLAGRLLGSVPANISHRASCDVLIVHTTGGKR